MQRMRAPTIHCRTEMLLRIPVQLLRRNLCTLKVVRKVQLHLCLFFLYSQLGDNWTNCIHIRPCVKAQLAINHAHRRSEEFSCGQRAWEPLVDLGLDPFCASCNDLYASNYPLLKVVCGSFQSTVYLRIAGTSNYNLNAYVT
jgi:hypothetical protein